MSWFKKVEDDAKENLHDNLLRFKDEGDKATIECSNHEVKGLKEAGNQNGVRTEVEKIDGGAKVTFRK